jgi:hypothetical protein
LTSILSPVFIVERFVLLDMVKSVQVEPLSVEYDIEMLDGDPFLLKFIELLSAKDSIVK